MHLALRRGSHNDAEALRAHLFMMRSEHLPTTDKFPPELLPSAEIATGRVFDAARPSKGITASCGACRRPDRRHQISR